jgi:two-component system nitrogen regulation sensor histidine kinase NtrY
MNQTESGTQAEGEAGPAMAGGGAPGTSAHEIKKRRREWIAAAILMSLFVGLTAVEFRLAQSASSVPFANSIVFFGLLNVNLILLIATVWLVSRNVGKIFLERRRRVLGARLKTKLVIAFLALSIIPTLLLFLISAIYINSSFERWFSIKIQNTLEASLAITEAYYKNANETAAHFAEHIASGISRRAARELKRSLPADAATPILEAPFDPPTWLHGFLEEQRELLVLESVEFYHDPLDSRVHVFRPGADGGAGGFPPLTFQVLKKAFVGTDLAILQRVATGEVIRAGAPVRVSGQVAGIVVVSTFLSKNLQNKVGEIASVVDDYRDINPLKYPMKTTFLVILILMTLVIIFVAIWVGLYLAKELTTPVERLVAGAREVGSGNLDVKIEKAGHDELGVLVDSFNAMTRDLSMNRSKLDVASRSLENRRQQLEAILSNVATGVVVVDRDGVVQSYNRAAEEILELPAFKVLGSHVSSAIPEAAEHLGRLLQESFSDYGRHSQHSEREASPQWNYRIGERTKALAAVVTPLAESSGSSPWGAVIAIDDITEALKGQREMAWREVARRIAHEIKNPLTPIKLSAQRMQRRLIQQGGQDSDFIRECTDTIITHTDELRDLVNEFSEFARLPEVSPIPNDLNSMVREVLALYMPAHPGIRFDFEAAPNLPVFEFDREQLKRVLINLLENSVAAFAGIDAATRVLCVRLNTQYEESLGLATLAVRDNGPGMPEDVLSRIFEPYFSTKSEGTGLGLAIAKRIVNDHNGFIRVNAEMGGGTEFLIELPTVQRQNSTGLSGE